MAKRDYIESSGNVFADLGFPDADDMLAKAELAIKITGILRRCSPTHRFSSRNIGRGSAQDFGPFPRPSHRVFHRAVAALFTAFGN